MEIGGRRRRRSGGRLAVILLGALAALIPSLVLAHGGGAPRPTFPGVLLRWEFDPLFLIALALTAGLYARLVAQVNAAHPANPFPRRRQAAFAAGMAALVLAIASPLAAYDTTLFSAHMVQHLLIISVAAPLLLLGQPITLLLRASSPRLRKEVILPLLHSRALKALAFPPLTWLLLTGVLWITHYSPLFNEALENAWLHRFEHALYLGSALLFWWPAIAADPAPWRMNHPFRLLYVFLQMPQNSFLAVSLANAGRVIFPHYEGLQRGWGPSPLSDQEWAGYIMWIGGDAGFLVALALLVYGWVQHEERAARRGDRARARAAAPEPGAPAGR